MKIKNGANIQGISYKMRKVLVHANKVWEDYGQELVITCGMDGEHSAGSLHYYGLAVDLRTNYFDNSALEQIKHELVLALGDDYDVFLHKTHMHVEYDPK